MVKVLNASFERDVLNDVGQRELDTKACGFFLLVLSFGSRESVYGV